MTIEILMLAAEAAAAVFMATVAAADYLAQRARPRRQGFAVTSRRDRHTPR